MRMVIVQPGGSGGEGGGSGYVLPPATQDTLGGIKVGQNLTIEEDGTLNAQAGGGSYVLPPATADTLGGVKIGSGINVSDDGTISAPGGGSSASWIEVSMADVFNNTNVNDDDVIRITGNIRYFTMNSNRVSTTVLFEGSGSTTGVFQIRRNVYNLVSTIENMTIITTPSMLKSAYGVTIKTTVGSGSGANASTLVPVTTYMRLNTASELRVYGLPSKIVNINSTSTQTNVLIADIPMDNVSISGVTFEKLSI